MGFKQLSLTWKLLLAFLLIIVVAVGVVSVLANQVAAREVRGFMFTGGMTDTQRLAEAFAAYYHGRGSWEGVEGLLPRTGRPMVGQTGPHAFRGLGGMMSPRLTLSSPAGVLIASNDPLAPGELSAEQRREAIPVQLGDETVALLSASFGEAPSLAQDLVQRVNRAVWLAALTAGVVGIILAWGMATGFLRPIRRLTLAAQTMARGDLSMRVPVETNDELGQLSGAFNGLAESLERGERLRREMTADIAHELRNPLAIMQAQLEGIHDGIYPSTPENLAPALEQTMVLNRLVDDLSTLARADEGGLVLEKVQVSLLTLLERIVRAHSEQAGRAGIDLSLEREQPNVISILADPIRLEQVLSNLLSNALRHTPPGGQIVVSLRKDLEENTVAIEVSDSGPGIPEADLANIFERLYRVDRGRSRERGGSGLGLAIAKKLVEAHGGRLEAANRTEGGARFSLWLPIGA